MVNGVTEGSTATYTCDIGYTIDGDSVRNCGSAGVWLEPEPSCQSMHIHPQVPLLRNSAFFKSSGESVCTVCMSV